MLDDARSDRSRELRARLERPAGRIRLVSLPSYSPNLNLIARSWPFRETKASIRQVRLKSLVTIRFHLMEKTYAGISFASDVSRVLFNVDWPGLGHFDYYCSWV